MFSKKVLVSTLLATCLACSANAGIKLIKTTDSTDFTEKLMATKGAFGDTKKKDNVMTEAEKVFLETGKNIYIGDARQRSVVKKDSDIGHAPNVMDQQPKVKWDLV